jgi:hypothetical protein
MSRRKKRGRPTTEREPMTGSFAMLTAIRGASKSELSSQEFLFQRIAVGRDGRIADIRIL